PSSGIVWGSALFLAVFCTGVAFIVQTIAQQYTSATHVGVIFTLEPVFAGIVAFALAGEILLPRAYFGAFLLLASLIIMEIDVNALVAKIKGKSI
ncbi:MAG: DMT family transporter, partial [Firmicutes bacterium]|nr:DMT family transporter [Bacillota bacterium]